MTSTTRQALLTLASLSALALVLLMTVTAEAKDLTPGSVPVGAKSIVAPKAPRDQVASSTADDQARQIVVEDKGGNAATQPAQLAELKPAADVTSEDAPAESAEPAPAPAPAAEAPPAPQESVPAEQQADDSGDAAAAYAYLSALYRAAHRSHGYSRSYRYAPAYDDCD
jgi:hypothetical protein